MCSVSPQFYGYLPEMPGMEVIFDTTELLTEHVEAIEWGICPVGKAGLGQTGPGITSESEEIVLGAPVAVFGFVWRGGGDFGRNRSISSVVPSNNPLGSLLKLLAYIRGS